ncbi:Sigma-70 family RNA polymerase sigma factor [Sulfidibacter corallicola]|uniref:Sigma-70 family RNA polymerase sigma factor n=1 Tax=Sulfidibacter corallicola TaxID=2818388 RepID=A0A8A4TGY9_SULCO|nr:ECF-type sigma factor [Sulfidibacter corallicola]QTD48820.1 sigma-70 family RNA polymerase sigma factor [Sulfidibacter corallicola]
MSKATPITQLLEKSNQGDDQARDQVLELLYNELHRIARNQVRSRNGTLSPTALVNEAYLKLFKGEYQFVDRQNLLAYAAVAMRQVILNYAQAAKAQKRGGDVWKVTFQEWDSVPSMEADFAALNEVLEQLETVHPHLAKILGLSYFAGFKKAEIAELLDISEAKVYKDLKIAKTWIYKKLKARTQDGADSEA